MKLIKKIKTNKTGFTLVEAVIAMAIFGMTSAAIMNGLLFGIFQIKMARDNARATQVMIEKFETLRLYSWAQLHSTNGYIPLKFTNGIYVGTITIKDVPFTSDYSSDICEFDITLQWNTDRLRRTRTMETFAAKYGLQNYVY